MPPLIPANVTASRKVKDRVDFSTLKVGCRVRTTAIVNEFLCGHASDVWVTKISKDWIGVEYGPHADVAGIPRSSITKIYQ